LVVFVDMGVVDKAPRDGDGVETAGVTLYGGTVVGLISGDDTGGEEA
jgi:hypothetical protein